LQKKLSKRRKVWKANRLLRAKPQTFKINEIDSTQEVRMDTTDSELNRVLEAVLFPSLILLGGEPGIGKAPTQISLNCLTKLYMFLVKKAKNK
jgi:DNA repair protein RadA/Sms